MTVSDLWWHKTNALLWQIFRRLLLATKLLGVWRRKDCVAAVSFLVEGEWSPGKGVPFQHPTSITALVQWKRQGNYTWLTNNIGLMCIYAVKWGIYSQDCRKSAKTDIFKSLEQYDILSFSQWPAESHRCESHELPLFPPLGSWRSSRSNRNQPPGNCGFSSQIQFKLFTH